MSVYKNSKPEEVKECLNSLYAQTFPSDDLVIVIDGKISSELQDFLDHERETHPEIHLYPIAENVGLGNALRYGMPFCRHEWIARMDTDDICVPERFEKQIACFEEDPELSIVGSDIAEFIGSPDHIVGYRRVPEEHNAICEYLKKRCPFNHMTVMFKKSEVERAGGYLDWHYNEDSYLWIRMYLAGCKFKNIPETFALVRVNEETYMRRGGWKYYKSEKNLFKFMRQNKIIGWFAYQKAKWIRFIGYVMLSNRIRGWAFKRFLRSSES